ncbi:MAG: hypothetical protein KA116_07215 [Proteobacteria bacterium]|nr:hypothetical protein [Pseudomonadota bacterium]
MRKNFLFIFAITVLMSASKVINAEEPMIVELDEATAKSLQGGSSTKATPTIAPVPKASTPTVTKAAPAPKTTAPKTTASKSNTHTSKANTASTNKSKATSAVPLKPFRENEEIIPNTSRPSNGAIGSDERYWYWRNQIVNQAQVHLSQKKESNPFYKLKVKVSSQDSKLKLSDVKYDNDRNLIHAYMQAILEDPRILDFLIREGNVDVHQKSSMGLTPLMELLAGFSPSQYPNTYNTVVQKLVYYSRSTSNQSPQTSSGKLYEKDNNGHSALNYAIFQANPDAVKIILDNTPRNEWTFQMAQQDKSFNIPINYAKMSQFTKQEPYVARDGKTYYKTVAFKVNPNVQKNILNILQTYGSPVDTIAAQAYLASLKAQ